MLVVDVAGVHVEPGELRHAGYDLAHRLALVRHLPLVQVELFGVHADDLVEEAEAVVHGQFRVSLLVFVDGGKPAVAFGIDAEVHSLY